MSAGPPRGRGRPRAIAVLVLLLVLVGGVASAAPARAASPPAPRLAARSAAVFEASTDQPVFALAAGRRHLIASTTKLMTALVTVASVPLTRVCTAPSYAAGPLETKIGLRAGERMSVHDLLRAALLPSANDAAATLAVCVAGSRSAFVARMNRRARELGLRHTHFTTPIGLDEADNYGTAADLDRLAIALRRDPFLRRTVDLPAAVLHTGARPRTVVNRNALVREVPWIDGVKTGHTNAAGYILIASGTRRGVTFVASVLGDPSEAARDRDALALLKWAFVSFRPVQPVTRGEVSARLPVAFRPDEHVAVVATRSVRAVVRRDARVHVAVDLPAQLKGPLPRGARVGTLTVHAGSRLLGRVALVTARAVPAVGLLERAGDALARPGSLVAVVAVLGGAIAVLVRRRGARHRRRVDLEAA